MALRILHANHGELSLFSVSQPGHMAGQRAPGSWSCLGPGRKLACQTRIWEMVEQKGVWLNRFTSSITVTGSLFTLMVAWFSHTKECCQSLQNKPLPMEENKNGGGGQAGRSLKRPGERAHVFHPDGWHLALKTSANNSP